MTTSSRRLSADLTLLRHRPFALLLFARTASMLASAFAPVALAFGVLNLPGASATTLSVVLTAEAVPLVVFMLAGGVIADRLPRQRVMMAGELMNAGAFAALGYMLLTEGAPVVAMAAAAAVTGIGMAMLFPALTGIIPEVVPKDRLQTGNAVLALGANTARIAGIVASGAAVVWIGGGWALIGSALLFGASAALISRIRLSARARNTSSSVLADLKEGWYEFRSRQWIWVVVAQFSVLVMALQAAHGVLGPVVAKAELGGAPAWSAILAGEAVGMVIGVLVAMRLRPRRPILFATLMVFPAALPYLLLGISAPLWTVVLAAFGLGVCFEIFGVLWQTTMQREIPSEALSRVSSYDALGSMMFGPIGLLIAGPVSIWIGPKPALIGAAVVIVASTLAALTSPGVRNLLAPDDDRPSDRDAGDDPVAAGRPVEHPVET
ncbi:MFS transporter [Nakamurella lactea]|uniref:MFS transporter n=1 Tax=Nakamurella lactea TaxID=459515 RepID=UPI00068568D9|nr:MFS transporter [Nakamurella lactea]